MAKYIFKRILTGDPTDHRDHDSVFFSDSSGTV